MIGNDHHVSVLPHAQVAVAGVFGVPEALRPATVGGHFDDFTAFPGIVNLFRDSCPSRRPPPGRLPAGGDPTEQAWSGALVVEKFYNSRCQLLPRPADGKSKALLGRRDGKLYIAVLGYEEDLDRLVRKNTERDTDVWADDCVELMFDPLNTEKGHYQFAINSVGALFDQADNDNKRNFKCEHAGRIFRDRGYWAMEFALLGKDLDGHEIKPGVMWSFNVFRTRIGAASEQAAIWPTFGHSLLPDMFPFAVFR